VTTPLISPIVIARTGLLCGLLFSGCAGHRLLTSDPPVASATAGGEENRTLLYERTYIFTPAGALTVRTHTIQRVGSNGTDEPLAVYDGSVEKLTAFEARVVHADRSVEWYGIGDLGSHSLVTGRVIADASLRYVYPKRTPLTGDLIESACEHDFTLPGLGTIFTFGGSGLPPLSVRCIYRVPAPDRFQYHVLNDSLAPRVTGGEGVTEYAFTWDSPPEAARRSVYAKSNDEPGVMAIDPQRGPSTWKEFGNWNYGLIASRFIPDERIIAEAKRVTQSATTDVEKMNAIAEYCQSNVRYEQVYLPRGEFIPNEAPYVLAKKFGDCKDYTCLIVTMARAVGLDAHPALCWRGRGYEICEDLPVNQFNHMIAHLSSEGKNYWYDGTNQGGTPGITSDDLVNARALILEKTNSRLAWIPELEENLFSIAGVLHPRGASLAGDLTIRLTGQYAVAFQFYAKWENEGNMRSLLAAWLTRELSNRLTVTALSWKSTGSAFEIRTACSIPNSLVTIDRTSYLRFDKVFDNILPAEEPGTIRGVPFEYPRYARVAIGLDVPGLVAENGTGVFHWDLKYALPPGPFSPAERSAFPGQLRALRARFEQTFKFPGKD